MLILVKEDESLVEWRGEKLDGVTYPLNIETLYPDNELQALGLYIPQEPVEHDPLDNIFDGYEFVNGTVYKKYTREVITPEILKDYSGSYRKNYEESGITVNGAGIYTNRESQFMISGIFNFCQVNPALVIQYKTIDGFITANSTVMQGIAIAVGTHVQNCFAKESEVSDLIDSGDITTRDEIVAAYQEINKAY